MFLGILLLLCVLPVFALSGLLVCRSVVLNMVFGVVGVGCGYVVVSVVGRYTIVVAIYAVGYAVVVGVVCVAYVEVAVSVCCVVAVVDVVVGDFVVVVEQVSVVIITRVVAVYV